MEIPKRKRAHVVIIAGVTAYIRVLDWADLRVLVSRTDRHVSGTATIAATTADSIVKPTGFHMQLLQFLLVEMVLAVMMTRGRSSGLIRRRGGLRGSRKTRSALPYRGLLVIRARRRVILTSHVAVHPFVLRLRGWVRLCFKKKEKKRIYTRWLFGKRLERANHLTILM